ncbi:MAG: Crp/Fnr family transcriptional regulator [Nitrospirota bacterium]
MKVSRLKLQGTIIGSLKKSSIFGVLTEEELKSISPLFQKVDLQNGEYIFLEGDPAEWLYVVTNKRVKIIKHTRSGRDVLLEIKSPGEIFCCATVLDNKPYPESAQAKEAASVIRIRRKNLLRIIDAYPLLRIMIARYLSEKLSDAYEMMKEMTTEIVESRIASLLLKLSEKAGTKDSGYNKIDFTLTRQEIADMVGTTVETSIRVMSKFRKLKIVRSTKNTMLVDAKALRRLLSN